MKTFYEWQRKRLKILLDEKQKPIGGKWSFDTENRKKLSKDYKEPIIFRLKENNYIKEAREYVLMYFKNNLGEIDNFNYAIDRQEALKLLDDFVLNRLEDFGKYEDAISSFYKTINHGRLSVYLNIGLIYPDEVIEKILFAYEKIK